METDNSPTPGNGQHASHLRKLPSVDRVLSRSEIAELKHELPHNLIVAAVRAELEDARTVLRAGASEAPGPGAIARGAALRARLMAAPSLRPVVNATGVVIHTNLGRAPLSDAAVKAIAAVSGYSNLEYDLDEGQRGSRYTHASQALRRVTGCEDALVVNNNAAALVLVLTALAAGREVILSRGQSVEIGGGFRIPDVMKQSGARLVEVGTTNRTYVRDYADALSEQTAALMRVHSSNFRIVGFTTTPGVEELAALARERGLLMLDDVGSGALLDTARFGLQPEPLVQDSLKAGADLVLFSGDKLLGGPQCGIIAGKAEAVARLRKHPLARALRVDKMTLSALEATLGSYIRGEAEREVPVWRMIAADEYHLKSTAESWAKRLASALVEADVVPGESAVGGGSLPGETLPTWLLRISAPPGKKGESSKVGEYAARLRQLPVPVIGRIEEGALLLDPRTVLPGQEDTLIEGVVTVYARP